MGPGPTTGGPAWPIPERGIDYDGTEVLNGQCLIRSASAYLAAW